MWSGFRTFCNETTPNYAIRITWIKMICSGFNVLTNMECTRVDLSYTTQALTGLPFTKPFVPRIRVCANCGWYLSAINESLSALRLLPWLVELFLKQNISINIKQLKLSSQPTTYFTYIYHKCIWFTSFISSSSSRYCHSLNSIWANLDEYLVSSFFSSKMAYPISFSFSIISKVYSIALENSSCDLSVFPSLLCSPCPAIFNVWVSSSTEVAFIHSCTDFTRLCLNNRHIR